MANDWELKSLERRVEVLDRKIRWVERYLENRERFWAKMTERAILVGSMTIATVTAVVVADRRR